MKKITPAHQTYRQVEDIREEPIRFGKYLYLAVLGTFLMVIVHLLFGHIYLLRGGGYVYSDNRAVELEFDATIIDLNVHEGDRVEPNSPLFTYDSLSFRNQLIRIAFDISELKNNLGELNIQNLEMLNQIHFAKKYATWSEGLRADLLKLSKKSLVPRTQLSTESFRSFEAKERLESFKAEKKEIELNIDMLKANIAGLEHNYQALENRYNGGVVAAGVSGIVNGLQITPGDVLEKGDNAMRIFYGHRYIYAFFDQSSWVKYSPGDTVFVRIPGKSYVRGKIKELLPVTNRIPEEFQPRFKRTRRDQLALIEVKANLLDDIAILSTVSIFKPFFM